MAAALQKSATTTAVGMHHQQLSPMRRQNPQIRIILQTLGPSMAPTNYGVQLKDINDSATFDSSWEQKPLLVRTPKQKSLRTEPKHCDKCKVRSENRFFSLRSHCKCKKSQPKHIEDENANVKPAADDLPDKKINDNQSKQCRLRIPFSDYLIKNSPVFRKKLQRNTSIDTELKQTANKMANQTNKQSVPIPRYIYKDEMFEPRLNTCSTPKASSAMLSQPVLNLHTPPADARHMDSDSESIGDDLPAIGLVKCFSFTRSSCRSITSTLGHFTRSPSVPSSQRRALDESPLRRQKNIKLSKKVNVSEYLAAKNLLNRSMDEVNGDMQAHDENGEYLGCHPLLTKENIESHLPNDDDEDVFDPNETINWGDKFEFSFICEPSTSDAEDDELEQKRGTEATPTKTKWVEPSMVSSRAGGDLTIIRPSGVQDAWLSSPIRRSISDPSFIHGVNLMPPPLIRIERDSDDHVTIHQATVVSLTTLTVSRCCIRHDATVIKLIPLHCQFYQLIHSDKLTTINQSLIAISHSHSFRLHYMHILNLLVFTVVVQ